MKLLPINERKAISEAKQLVTTLRIRRPEEIDIELIASYCGAHVTYKRIAKEEGHLLRAQESGLIVVAETARLSAKWRFVIAHELGHFICHRGIDQLNLCTDTDLHDWYLSSGHEPEANRFAAELLMPEFLFRKQCEVTRPSLRDITKLAQTFNVSLTAAALRFVFFSPEPVAVVSSKAGVIQWWSATEDFQVQLRKGFTLSTRTYAGDLFAGRSVEDRPTAVDADAWGDDFTGGLELLEHSMFMARYDSALTLLWHPYQDQE